MPKIFTPTNQLKLTDVAVVRLKKGGKRFEIACHKSKVIAWRNKLEHDIDDVLQIHTVFINVSKGQAAKKDELINAFGNCDETSICKEILEKGELQVSEKERQGAIDTQLKDVVSNIANLYIDTGTRLPIGAQKIEQALRDAHFTVNAQKNTATQDALRLLHDNNITLIRARMRLSISYRSKAAPGHLRESLHKQSVEVESEEWENDKLSLILLIEPGNYTNIDQMVRSETRGKATIELLEPRTISNAPETAETTEPTE